MEPAAGCVKAGGVEVDCDEAGGVEDEGVVDPDGIEVPLAGCVDAPADEDPDGLVDDEPDEPAGPGGGEVGLGGFR